MKNLFSLLLAFLFIVFAGCKSHGPEEAAQKYLNAMMRMDFETAKSVSTEETKKIISTMQLVSETMVPDSIKQRKKTVKVKIENTEVKDDGATVTYTTSESAAQMKLFLVKQKDKWLVEASKLDEFNRAGVDADASEGDAPDTDSTAAGLIDTTSKQ